MGEFNIVNHSWWFYKSMCTKGRATKIEESNAQGYSTNHFDFNAAVGQAKDLLAWEENTFPDLDKAMGSYLEDEFPWAVKSGCALLKSIPSWELAQQVLQRCHGE